MAKPLPKCSECPSKEQCRATYGTYFGVMRNTANCRQSYIGFGSSVGLGGREERGSSRKQRREERIEVNANSRRRM